MDPDPFNFNHVPGFPEGDPGARYPLPANPYQAQLDANPRFLHEVAEWLSQNPSPQHPVALNHYTGDPSAPWPPGGNIPPPNPVAPNTHAGNTSADFGQWHEPFDAGSPIRMNDPDFNFFDEEHHPAQVDGYGGYSAATAPDPDPAPDHSNAYIRQEKYGQSTTAYLDGVSHSDYSAPVAQMQAPHEDTNEGRGPADAAPSLAAGPRGKLRLAYTGQGRCEFLSKQGNTCRREAQIMEAMNRNKERCCMCSKHEPQWRRNHALPPSVPVIIKTLAQAKQEIYPDHEPLIPSDGQTDPQADPSLEAERGQEDKWQVRFLEAALTPYEGDDKKLADHQNCLNGNMECDDVEKKGWYTDDQINSRMAVLYHIAWSIHMGGERVYGIHGDNSGYAAEKTVLTLLGRLEYLEELLKENKRIVLDVIQGRGVEALVANPYAYNQRKSTNNTNNQFKKRPRPAGDDPDGQNEGEEFPDTPTPPPKKKRAVKQAVPKAKKGGNGKEKAFQTPTPLPQDLNGVNADSKDNMQQPPSAVLVPSRASGSEIADPGPSQFSGMDLNLGPRQEDQGAVPEDEGWICASPRTFNKMLRDHFGVEGEVNEGAFSTLE